LAAATLFVGAASASEEAAGRFATTGFFVGAARGFFATCRQNGSVLEFAKTSDGANPLTHDALNILPALTKQYLL
jgi:hypothetical protein